MFRLIFFLASIYICQLSAFAGFFLEGRISPQDKRYTTFKCALELIQQRQAKILVETGTARNGVSNCHGDGCSTVIFGHFAAANQCKLYSVDIDARSLQCAKSAIKSYVKNVEFIHNDSVAFLRDFPYTIDFLYLDSYDFELNNPTPSQQHHLKEIIAAYPHLTRDSIVMIDDCDLPYGGKGKLVIQYLLERGWKICAQGYQMILVQ